MSLITVAIATTALASDSRCPVAAGAFAVSFPAFPVPAAERIVGYEVMLTGGRVVHIDDLPKGWSLKVDVDDPNRQKLSGATQPASEPLRVVTDLPTFHAVREAEGGAAPFDLEGVVYTSADAKTYVRHRFECRELVRAVPPKKASP